MESVLIGNFNNIQILSIMIYKFSDKSPIPLWWHILLIVEFVKLSLNYFGVLIYTSSLPHQFFSHEWSLYYLVHQSPYLIYWLFWNLHHLYFLEISSENHFKLNYLFRYIKRFTYNSSNLYWVKFNVSDLLIFCNDVII